ncbi:MAG: sulfite exporter TauE/SafE family protein [Pseudomonadales bacterium]|nr:sulfite exporter TauE/SafE family protein [Pseudomonadales bacterium]
MTELQSPYLIAFFLGLMGSTHCIGMCGGISGSIGLTLDERPLKTLLYTTLFNLGRINSYVFAGLLIGTLGTLVSSIAPAPATLIAVSRTLSGILLVVMALYIGQWWSGLAKLEHLVGGLWQHIQPLTRALLPVRQWHQALLVGFIWGWIPCGLVYSTLIWASLTTQGIDIALLMLCFGFGTAPAMISTLFFANKLAKVLQHKFTRSTLAGALIVFGLWTIIGGNMHYFHTGSSHTHTESSVKIETDKTKSHAPDAASTNSDAPPTTDQPAQQDKNEPLEQHDRHHQHH